MIFDGAPSYSTEIGMERLLLRIWREACRHIELAESVANIADMLAREMPLQLLAVQAFEPRHDAIDIVASAQRGRQPTEPHARRNLSAAQWKRLLAWARAGELTWGPADIRQGELSLLVPTGAEGEVIAGPLASPEGPAGVLLLVAAPGDRFKSAHRQIARSLLEPFSVALENHRRLHELQALRDAAEADRRSLLARLGRQEISETVIGGEGGLKHVMERVALVKGSDVPVLILGETGTGKEVVSRAIHTGSKRAGGPFIRVNCGAIPSELIDSQLFGHEKGSFTGASDTRQGWFERADGGTLFLDEIGELPLQAQVRLLRVLQDGFIERVGGSQPIRVDVRIVAATHRDLAAMVKDGTFREDLWYRINVFPILLPRLAERQQDIPDLARHFARRAANRFGLPYAEPTEHDLELLRSYPWPGNIRELGAVIDRAAILGEGERLEIAKALGPVATAGPRRDVVRAPIAATAATSSIASLDDAIRSHIEVALAATRGRIEGARGAAQLLGINPHTLRAKMRKLGLDWSKFRQE